MIDRCRFFYVHGSFRLLRSAFFFIAERSVGECVGWFEVNGWRVGCGGWGREL